MKYIYKITHFYGDDERSIFLKSEKDVNELIEILACIDFKFEEVVDLSGTMSEKSIGLILKRFYGAEIISGDLKRYLEVGTRWNEDERDFSIVKVFEVDGYAYPVIQIDRFWARESCCGPNYVKLMEKYIPTDSEFSEMIKCSELF